MGEWAEHQHPFLPVSWLWKFTSHSTPPLQTVFSLKLWPQISSCQIFGIRSHYKDKWPVHQVSKCLKLGLSRICQDKKGSVSHNGCFCLSQRIPTGIWAFKSLETLEICPMGLLFFLVPFSLVSGPMLGFEIHPALQINSAMGSITLYLYFCISPQPDQHTWERPLRKHRG